MLGSGIDLQVGAENGALALDAAGIERLGTALRAVFAACAGVSTLAVIPLLALPPVDFGAGTRPSAGEELITAEMTTLDPKDEPRAVER